MSENTRNSTVAISPDDAKRLEKFCKANRITKRILFPFRYPISRVKGLTQRSTKPRKQKWKK